MAHAWALFKILKYFVLKTPSMDHFHILSDTYQTDSWGGGGVLEKVCAVLYITQGVCICRRDVCGGVTTGRNVKEKKLRLVMIT